MVSRPASASAPNFIANLANDSGCAGVGWLRSGSSKPVCAGRCPSVQPRTGFALARVLLRGLRLAGHP